MNDFVVSINGTAWDVKILSESELLLNNKKYNYELISSRNNSYLIKLNNEIFNITSERIDSDSYKILLEGNYFDITVRTALQERAAKLLENSASAQHHYIEIKAPMPGLILKVRKKMGDKVEQGESVIILEAMKMENDLKAPASGAIEKILVTEGSAVEKGAVLFSIG
jgi:biotin carboxyl carrier protein